MSTSDLPGNPLTKTAVFIQHACLQHKYIRSKDLSNIVERPERLRAVNIGLSAAIARLRELFDSKSIPKAEGRETTPDPEGLANVLNKLHLGPDDSKYPVKIIQSQSSLDIMTHQAIKFVHGDIERDVYLETLSKWIRESANKITEGLSEIPEGYSQGDLYLCPSSLNALQGATGTICEAVDAVVSSSRSSSPVGDSPQRAFVAIRPPGHHCGEDTPSGFCFLNNVAVAAAHAHLQHGMKRIVIFDIDLHHGNGTQSIIWQINEETYRQQLEVDCGATHVKPGPKIYYGSVHDILSYPCEDGKVELVQAASTSIHGSHGQYIENVHLETYSSEEHFWDVLYKEKYSKLLTMAREFLDDTGGPGDDVMVFISCGMDACEHEYESMSRHNRKVPVSFYYRFARDACALSDKYAGGRLISALEGGYSDRALTSGAMAHLTGLVDVPEGAKVDEQWWSLDNLVKLEQATKKRRGGRPSLSAQGSVESWVEEALAIFTPLDAAASQVLGRSKPRISAAARVPASDRTLRDRSKPNSLRASPLPGSRSIPASTPSKPGPPPDIKLEGPSSTGSSPLSSRSSSDTEEEAPATKKLPRIVLKLGKPPPETVDIEN